MRRLALLLVLLGASVSLAAVSYINFEQLTLDATAGGVGMTAAKIRPDGSGGARQATFASCRLETAEVRFTYDGTAPTTTVGTLLEIGDTLTLSGQDNLTRFRGIRTGATSGVLNCTYTQP